MSLSLPRNVKIDIKGSCFADAVEIRLKSRRDFTIALRIPEYCTGVYYCGCLLDWHREKYLCIRKPWRSDEVLRMEFDPRVRRIDAPGKAPREVLMRGPVVLAEEDESMAGSASLVQVRYNKRRLIDYASAGLPVKSGGHFAVWYKKLQPKYLYNYFDYD